MTEGRTDGPTDRLLAGITVVMAMSACTPGASPVSPSVVPSVRPSVVDTAHPIAPPAEAAAMGWMPLASTNVPAFARAFPAFDGRGVLIAILDAGLDAGVLGPQRTLDVRDFSGEGRIPLAEARLDGDRVTLDHRSLAGAGRIRAMQSAGHVWGGTVREYDLGELPAADVNGNGVFGDTLLVFVARGTDGWALFTDTDGDGSLANERPIRDYLVAHDAFGWHRPGKPSPGSVAVNLADRGVGQSPLLDLVYTVGSHGTHVAGIAAGSDLYGVTGFNGVAPGASLLALKIANDARGGITTTGSIVRAMNFAIRFAAARRLPLVMNLSFGVGNEVEGAAVIDRVVDSILAANPRVVMTVSAGNDGPGVSTMGFPASARRVINVGATYPGAFLPPVNGRRSDDLIAFFSSRGGELAQPDLVAPGVAYSSIPPFDTGEEIKNGTSMAAPHVAGLAARLLSGLAAERRTADAETVRRALMASARPLLGGTWIDQGAGLPDLLRAWQVLKEAAPGPVIDVATRAGVSGSLQVGSPAPEVGFTLRARGGRAAGYRLVPDVDWLTTGPMVSIGDSARVGVRVNPEAVKAPGVHTGVVEGWGADSAWGPAFHLVTTVVTPFPLPPDSARWRFRVAEGQIRRVPFRADSGRGVRFTIADPRGAPLLAFLHEPGGMPWRGGQAQSAADTGRAVFELNGRDVVGGVYELVLMAGPTLGVDAVVDVEPSPVNLRVVRRKDSVRVTTEAPSVGPAARLTASWLGAERGITTSARGSADQSLEFFAPAWAKRVLVELTMPREQWPLFTDFGFTLVDADGRQIAASPVNYAIARLEAEIPEGPARQLRIVLSPGFADPAANPLWNAQLSIRLYAPTPADLGAIGGSFTVPSPPFTLPSGFHPLLDFIAHRGDRVWHRETGLPEAPGPVMP